MRNNISITCFSEINNSSLMYSHYSDSHKGICLQFNITDDTFYQTLYSVHYEKEIPCIRYFKQTPESLIKLQLSTKQSEWSYEKEWRIINPSKAGFVSFPPQSLTGIIFALNTSESDISLIKELTKFRQPQLSFYKCKISSKSFALTIEPI